MTIDKVIELGQSIKQPDYPWYSEFGLSTVLIVLGFLIGSFLLFTWADDLSILRPVIGTFMWMAAVVVMIATIGQSFTKQDEAYERDINKWRDEVAKPYINSLSVEKKEVVYLKIDAELTSKTEGNLWWGTGYIRSKIVERTPLIVSYKDKGIKTKTNWFETDMSLTDQEKPYIEFQRLDKDLGHGIKKGIYNAKVYLPENYSFTEIK